MGLGGPGGLQVVPEGRHRAFSGRSRTGRSSPTLSRPLAWADSVLVELIAMITYFTTDVPFGTATVDVPPPGAVILKLVATVAPDTTTRSNARFAVLGNPTLNALDPAYRALSLVPVA